MGVLGGDGEEVGVSDFFDFIFVTFRRKNGRSARARLEALIGIWLLPSESYCTIFPGFRIFFSSNTLLIPCIIAIGVSP